MREFMTSSITVLEAVMLVKLVYMIKISIENLKKGERTGMKKFLREFQSIEGGLSVDFVEYRGIWCKNGALTSNTLKRTVMFI